MPAVRRCKPSDLFRLNICNLDPFVENYGPDFYLQYLMKWPSLFFCIEDKGIICGYIIGKVESSPAHLQGSQHFLPWHGHITALAIAPQYRRLGYAKMLTRALERACNQQNAWFMDLFVRKSNFTAIAMYESMGYTVYRTVAEYYSDGVDGSSDSEDAYDMRLALDRDKDHKHIREEGRTHIVQPDDVF